MIERTAPATGYTTGPTRFARWSFGVVVCMTIVMAWFVVLPLWDAGSVAETEATRLARRIAARERLEGELAVRNDACAILERERGSTLRRIPQDPSQAQLMRAMSEPVNGVDLISQTIAAGKSVLAAREGPKSWRAVPVTVAMKSTFETCMRVLRRAEQSDRLVRTLELDLRRNDGDALGVLDVSIVVDAVWNDPALEKLAEPNGGSR